MEERISSTKDKIEDFFLWSFSIGLSDSPQILKDYLYLEFWARGREWKFRIPYPMGDLNEFLDMNTVTREHYIMRYILSGVLS